MTNETQACSNCRYSEINTQKITEYGCRRFPPIVSRLTVVTSTGQQGVQTICQFPTVKGDAWCGEWETKIVVEEGEHYDYE